MVGGACANGACGTLGDFANGGDVAAFIFHILKFQDELRAAKNASFVFALKAGLAAIERFGSNGSNEVVHLINGEQARCQLDRGLAWEFARGVAGAANSRKIWRKFGIAIGRRRILKRDEGVDSGTNGRRRDAFTNRQGTVGGR